MANTLISYNGANAYYNNDNVYAPFIQTKAQNIYLNENCTNMFRNCFNLKNATFNNFFNEVNTCYVKECRSMFDSCNNLNSNIQIPINAINCASMFNGCSNLNQNILIPPNVNNCYYMFGVCINLNHNIQIPNNVLNCLGMFYHCRTLNYPIRIPAGVQSTSSMFSSCFSLNCDITIPASVQSCSYMFSGCNSFTGNIFININTSQTVHNFYAFVMNKNNSKRINIYCNNLALLNNNYANRSIVKNNITWSSTTNGYRNTVYNIYLFKNYTGNL